MGAKLAKATIDPSGVISPAQVVADAPSFGELYSVTRAPDGRIWAVVLPQAGATSLMVYPGLGAPFSVPTPYYPGDARLELTSAVDGVLVIHEYGSITDPIASAPVVGGSVGAFSPVAGTWSLQGFGLVRATSGVHVVASRDNASYETVMAVERVHLHAPRRHPVEGVQRDRPSPVHRRNRTRGRLLRELLRHRRGHHPGRRRTRGRGDVVRWRHPARVPGGSHHAPRSWLRRVVRAG